jgi:two-component system nitrate/nitrite response regulator NarL
MSQLSQPLSASISVLIADADRMSAHLIADGLTRGRNDIVVVALSNSSAETIRELEKSQPDIALINAHLNDGRMRGYHVLQYLQMLSPKTAAIMLIPDSDRDLVVDAFRGGAKGVFCRLQPIKLLPKCIRTVHEGQIWADTRNLAFLLEFLTQLKPLRLIKPGGGMTRLTPRESEVVHLLELGVSSRVELALYAVAREDLTRPMGD